MKAIRGLDLTPEEAEGVRKWREFVQTSRTEGRLRRWYDEVDRMFPGLDRETRRDLADTMFRKDQSEKQRAIRARQ